MNSPFIITVGGTEFHFEEPTPEQIDIQHIAHALAVQPRFTGHTNWLEYGFAYSVGQHSVTVSALVNLAGGSVLDQMWGLLHDAAEAYMGDCSTPLKGLVGPLWRPIEDKITSAVCQRFGLDSERPAVVHWADKHAMRLESRDLHHPALAAMFPVEDPHMADQKLMPWDSRFTYAMFLRTFEELKRRMYAS